MNLKKVYVLILALLMSFSVVACTGNGTETTQPTTQQTTEQLDPMPVIEGVSDKTISQLDELDLLAGISASDAQDGDLTASLVLDDGGFSNLDVATFTVTVSVTDSDNNTVSESFEVDVVSKDFNDADWAKYDIGKIEVEYSEDGTALVLPKWSTGNVVTYFYWSSDNSQVITNDGYIIKPHVGSDPVTVTLTCTAVHVTAVETQDFQFTIEPNPESSVTSKVSVPFYGTSDEYVVDDKTGIDIYYMDNGTVPYIDIETFVNMVDGAIESTELTFTPVGETGLEISYQVEYTDWDEVTIITEDFLASVDFAGNTFTVNNFDFFGSYIASTESDYGSGLVYTGADYVDGQQVTIPLGDYNFDLVMYEDGGEMQYLFPFAVANQLILGDVYYETYFNGDEIYGLSVLLTPSDEEDALFDQIRTSSLNTQDMALDMKLATYNFMALTIDYFYGLKKDKGIDSGYDIMNAYAKSILTGNDRNLYSKLFDIAYGLDDLHTSHNFPGYYEAPYGMGLSVSDLGPKVTGFYEYLWDIQDALIVKYGGDPDTSDLDALRPTRTLLDNDTIAVIHIDGFNIDTPDEFKATLDALPASVTDVVIDLSYNTGGNIGAVLRIWGYMQEEAIMYHSQNPADGAAVTYYIESEYVAYDYNWYILSSGVTFSAANMFTNIAKEQGVPILGQDSSGGASSISAIITPDGTSLIVSSNSVLSTRVGNEIDGYEYLSVENGIEVDYFMSDVTSDSQLINLINQLRS